MGRCITYTQIRLLLFIHPIISSFFFLSNFQHWNFSSHFSRELCGLEDWNLVHTWTVGRCIMYTGIRLLLLICPFISSFFFLQFSTLKFFITLFSGTVRPRRLKLGTHLDSAQMYRVYQNQAAAFIHPFISSFYFLSNFQTLKIFITLFSGTMRPEDWNLVHTWTVGSCIVYTGIRLLLIHPFISSFFFLSNYQTLNIFITFFSGTVRSRRLKLGTHVDSGQMYRPGIRLLLLICPFVSSFSFQFSNIKFFHNTLLTNCKA